MKDLLGYMSRCRIMTFQMQFHKDNILQKLEMHSNSRLERERWRSKTSSMENRITLDLTMKKSIMLAKGTSIEKISF